MAVFEHLDLLKEMHAERYIHINKHPDFPLWICNYAKKTQHKGVWNAATTLCRGLILDENNRIVSRPFPKFFNYHETNPEEIPDEPFTVTDKVDGSLGISYFYKGVWRIATRGSFTGNQAIKATEMLQGKYADCLPKMNPDHTYLFEIIYPENHIIVNYGEREELVLLAVIDTETGAELENISETGFPVLEKMAIRTLEEALAMKKENAEGLVLRYASGFRLKVKFEEYLHLHRVMMGVNEINVWRYLSSGRKLDVLIETSPEEYRQWITDIGKKILVAYNEVLVKSTIEFQCLPQCRSKKEYAEHIKGNKYEGILFNFLNNKPVEQLCWQYAKPEEEGEAWFSAGRG
ncbi:hypothetical protein FACS189434_02170 [Bacteroidia bacterium]|nr:hypothetical protein FACS189434_02170 [Bacteroidia bacterium]